MEILTHVHLITTLKKKWTFVLSIFAWPSDQYRNTQNPESQRLSWASSINRKSLYLKIYIYGTRRNQKLERKTCTTAGKTWDKHLNPAHWLQNPQLLRTEAALSPRAKLNLQSTLQNHSAGTSTSLLDLHCAQQADLKKPRKTFIWSFFYLWTSRSTWQQLQVLWAQRW